MRRSAAAAATTRRRHQPGVAAAAAAADHSSSSEADGTLAHTPVPALTTAILDDNAGPSPHLADAPSAPSSSASPSHSPSSKMNLKAFLEDDGSGPPRITTIPHPHPPESRSDLPLLIYLPGIDGSGLAAARQFPSLLQRFDMRSLVVTPQVCERAAGGTCIEVVRWFGGAGLCGPPPRSHLPALTPPTLMLGHLSVCRGLPPPHTGPHPLYRAGRRRRRPPAGRGARLLPHPPRLPAGRVVRGAAGAGGGRRRVAWCCKGQTNSEGVELPGGTRLPPTAHSSHKGMTPPPPPPRPRWAAEVPSLVDRLVLVNPATSFSTSLWPLIGPLLPQASRVAV